MFILQRCHRSCYFTIMYLYMYCESKPKGFCLIVLCTNDKHNPGRPSVVYHIHSLRDKLKKLRFLELKLVVHIPLLKVYFSKINTPKLLKLQNKSEPIFYWKRIAFQTVGCKHHCYSSCVLFYVLCQIVNKTIITKRVVTLTTITYFKGSTDGDEAVYGLICNYRNR